jgi:hypothetical protein
VRIIGLAGLKTSGKDSTYEAIKAAQTDLNVARVGFADKLKVFVAKSLGYEGSEASLIDLMNECKEDWEFDVLDAAGPFAAFDGRQLLQRIGEQARESFGDEFWVDHVLPFDIARRALYGNVDVLCVTDVRYANEAFRILQLGGEVWEIRRPGTASDGHVTEEPLPASIVTRVLKNDGSLNDLAGQVGRALA